MSKTTVYFTNIFGKRIKMRLDLSDYIKELLYGKQTLRRDSGRSRGKAKGGMDVATSAHHPRFYQRGVQRS